MTQTISTIVDLPRIHALIQVYMTQTISTIVDSNEQFGEIRTSI